MNKQTKHRFSSRLRFGILAIALILATPLCLAKGGQDGGGGGVIRCEKADGPTYERRVINGEVVYIKVPPHSSLSHNRSFELLDLWEAESGNGPFLGHLTTVPYDGSTPKAVQIDRAIKRLASVDPAMAKDVQTYHAYVTQRMFPAPAGDYVLAPEDTDVRFLPRGCSIEGLGSYSDRQDDLVYDAAIMKALPPMDQAAFEIHEAVYKMLRVHQGATDSWQTRRIVGLMFSAESFTSNDLINGFHR